jgi:ArsR family transcriptional regulator, arsenate/arsenite/antimonite-responsive transcriptional repressor / arsenate reductase (thioredoxin)
LPQPSLSDKLAHVQRPDVEERAKVHAALGETTRLAIVDSLAASDRSPQELQQRFALPSNLLAHHLDVLEAAGLIERSRSSGDGRRRYVHLRPDALDHLRPQSMVAAQPALFVCTANSARSQLAAALWRTLTEQPAVSAGTHPAERIHPGAVAAGRRAGVDLTMAAPRPLVELTDRPALTITVCDRAHEELDPPPGWLHWSIPDPVPTGTRAAFDATVSELRRRIDDLVGAA